jgi:hypothetical protein
MSEDSGVIAILQEEVKSLRERSHSTANAVTALTLIVNKLDNRKVCDTHMDFLGKIDSVSAKVDVIIANIENLGKQMNGTILDVSKHIEESIPFRVMAIKHDEAIKGMSSNKGWIISTLIAVVFAIAGGAVTWGEFKNRIANLESYTQFILKNSYGVQAWEKAHTAPVENNGGIK